MHACRRQRSGGGRFVTKPEDEVNIGTSDGLAIATRGGQNRLEG